MIHFVRRRLRVSQPIHAFKNILSKASDLKDESTPFQLYTEATCKEFHALLLETLTRFRSSLQILVGPTSQKRVLCPEDKRHLTQLKESGYLLHMLAKTGALKIHLKTIQPFLEANHYGSLMTPKTGEWATQEDEDNDPDEELDAVRPKVLMACLGSLLHSSTRTDDLKISIK